MYIRSLTLRAIQSLCWCLKAMFLEMPRCAAKEEGGLQCLPWSLSSTKVITAHSHHRLWPQCWSVCSVQRLGELQSHMVWREGLQGHLTSRQSLLKSDLASLGLSSQAVETFKDRACTTFLDNLHQSLTVSWWKSFSFYLVWTPPYSFYGQCPVL